MRGEDLKKEGETLGNRVKVGVEERGDEGLGRENVVGGARVIGYLYIQLRGRLRGGIYGWCGIGGVIQKKERGDIGQGRGWWVI